MSKPTEKNKDIRIVWGDTQDIEYKYANNLSISHAGKDEFHLVFGHLKPPIIVGMTNDELPDNIEVKPTACVVITKDNMKAFIKIMQENYDNFTKGENDA